MTIPATALPLKRGSSGDSVRALQRLLGIAADGAFGPATERAVRAFQAGQGLTVDGVVGPLTAAKLNAGSAAPAPAPAPSSSVPADWMPQCSMQRIIAHWTAGAYRASDHDRECYHILVEGDGRLIRGDHEISDNVDTTDDDYAAHTRACNTGSIGVSMCCMGGDIVQERPFVAGPYPMTRVQWDAMVDVVAALCRRYRIPVTPRTVLSHAEVQGTLGIRQNGKWDFTRLAFDLSVVGAEACGDRLRAEVSAKLGGG